MLLLVAACALAGCATQRLGETATAKGRQVSVPQRRYAGAVRMVVADSKFVVLDFTGTVPPSTGTVFEVVRDGRTIARVKTDSEQSEHSNLRTADILEGEPQNGDYVQTEGASASVTNEGTATRGGILPTRRQNFGPR